MKDGKPNVFLYTYEIRFSVLKNIHQKLWAQTELFKAIYNAFSRKTEIIKTKVHLQFRMGGGG